MNNVYVTGTRGVIGNFDVFVTKLDALGSPPSYFTTFGGHLYDDGLDIAIDGMNNVYVTGRTFSSNFPSTTGAYDESFNGFVDIFVTRLNTTGVIISSTFLGGPGDDQGGGIVLDSAGNIWVTGATSSSDFPTTTEAYDRSYNGGEFDVFVAELDAECSSLLYSSFFGGSGTDQGAAIVRDDVDNLYITGGTKSSDFSSTAGAYDISHNGNYDVFVMKLSENQPPVADAGPDQTGNELTQVTLNGSGSNDPNGDHLTYQQTQVAGPSVVLNLTNPVHPTFTAPNVPRDGATITFQLTVSDGTLTSDPDEVNITVKDVNHPPVTDAGPNQTVQEGSPVTLDGTNSYDPDSDRLAYSWVQTVGPTVVLSGPDTAQPTFTAPFVGRSGATLTFVLTVSDGLANMTDTVNVVVDNINHAPIANAGDDQTKNEGSLITLDGTISDDPDQDTLTYTWTQVSGPVVTLTNAHTSTSTFTAPSVGHGGAP